MSDCQFCSQLFTTQGGKVPRNLNCGHTICNNCVERYSKYGQVLCIDCEEVTKFKGGVKLPLSHSVIKMIDEPQCPLHPDSFKRRRHAKFFCYECTTAICIECAKSSVHRCHTVTPMSDVGKSYRGRLDTKKVFFEKQLKSLKSVNVRLENLKDKIFRTRRAQEYRLQEALSSVLQFEGIQRHPEIDRQLLVLVNNYEDDVVRKQCMVADALNTYMKAVADLESIQNMDDYDLAFQEREIANLENLKIPHDTWEIPNAGLENFHPVILGGRLHLRTMKFVKCHDLDDCTEDKFSDFMRSRPNAFHVGPKQIVVFSHEDIFHMNFEKDKLPMVASHTRMFSGVKQNHGQVHFHKEDKNWIISRVYDPEDMKKYVLPDNAEKIELGNNEKEALETYWQEIFKLGKIVIKQDHIIYPIL